MQIEIAEFQTKEFKLKKSGQSWVKLTQIAKNYNVKIVISEVYAFLVLSLGSKVNTIRMSQPDMGYIFHIKNQ